MLLITGIHSVWATNCIEPALPKSKLNNVNAPTATVAMEVTSATILMAASLAFGVTSKTSTPSIGRKVPTLSTQLSSLIICMVLSPVV